MKNSTYIISLILTTLCFNVSVAQIGVLNSNPKSLFDISASNAANPANTDGILIPRIDTFPDIDPGENQDGMLVFLTARSENYKKGIHYWDDAANRWTPFGGEFIDGYNKDLDNLSYAKQANANGVDVVFLDNGRLGMGTDNPEESLEIKFEGDNDIQVSSVTPPNAPNIIFYTTGGTFTSPDFLNNNDAVNGLSGKVWTGSGKSDEVATINAVADGNHSSGNLPTKYIFSVTKNGDDSEADSGNEMVIRATGKVGIGTDNPNAVLQLKAGTSGVNSAPIKFNAGTNLTTPEAGAIEFDGNHLYVTPNNNKRHILLKGLSNTVTLDFPLLVNGVTDQLNVNVPGATVGSSCNCAPVGGIEVGLSWSCYVSAANTVTVRLSKILNLLTPIDPASRTWKVTVVE